MKFLVAALALALTAGCVYSPVHVELYNTIAVENADIGIDASRITDNDLYEQVK